MDMPRIYHVYTSSDIPQVMGRGQTQSVWPWHCMLKLNFPPHTKQQLNFKLSWVTTCFKCSSHHLIYHVYTRIYHVYPLWIYMVYPWIYNVYPWIYNIYPHHWIYHVYTWIYHLYTRHIGDIPICLGYTWYIPGIY